MREAATREDLEAVVEQLSELVPLLPEEPTEDAFLTAPQATRAISFLEREIARRRRKATDRRRPVLDADPINAETGHRWPCTRFYTSASGTEPCTCDAAERGVR